MVSSPQVQFVHADPQHFREPPSIARVGALFAFLPCDSGARCHSAPKGQRLLGEEEPLPKPRGGSAAARQSLPATEPAPFGRSRTQFRTLCPWRSRPTNN